MAMSPILLAHDLEEARVETGVESDILKSLKDGEGKR
jgi:hypothetical protein